MSLPTGQQIATAAGDTTWTTGASAGTSYRPASTKTWLFVGLKQNVINSYWTSTKYNTTIAWRVNYNSRLSTGSISAATLLVGVRPVITVSKDSIS